MTKFDEPIERLIEYFKSLPGVGYKTAQRYAYSIIEGDDDRAKNFASAIVEAKRDIHFCSECGMYTVNDVCEICQNRNKKVICVVKEPKDVIAMEKVKNYDGVYHVLFGCLNPLENKGPEDIRVKELLLRVQKDDVKEVIMATNPDVEGEATAMYIAKILKPFSVKVTRLAQGISFASDLEFADEVTLSKALEGRKEIWTYKKKFYQS